MFLLRQKMGICIIFLRKLNRMNRLCGLERESVEGEFTMRSWIKSLSFNRFLPGFVVATMLLGGAAIAVNVNNTPQGGYLLCANNKTRAVTYPGTLKCPSGTTAIEVPGQNGFAASSNSPVESSPSPQKSSSAPTSGGDSRCTLTYLQANPGQRDIVLPLCSSTQFGQLQSDLNVFSQQCETALAELKKDATLNADKIAKKISECKDSMSILTSIVSAIAKKVKA